MNDKLWFWEKILLNEKAIVPGIWGMAKDLKCKFNHVIKSNRDYNFLLIFQ